MKARLVVALVALAGLMAAALNVSVTNAMADGIRSRPVALDVQKYRPKHGCFATGTRDLAGNTQLVCH